MAERTAALALRFDAPMQSWGVRSRGIIRDTTAEPTKSGVVGVLAAALGYERDDRERIAELARLALAVRVDREGVLERDYHTAGNVPTTQGTGRRTVVSERYYLADALFLVVLEGRAAVLDRVAAAVEEPRWPLFFGRRAYVPASPLLIDTGPVDRAAAEVLADHRWLESRTRLAPAELRTVVECPPGDPNAETRHDHPISFAHGDRRFAPRTVRVGSVPLTDDMITGGKPCS
ncbi:type I-E CRISPR-associated protein Cas5/CasD [Actinokineospora auranticolor]|uniref:CRISPR system Cascade subunit CasD n=1 Tax=Actinokineospora auranticolor TaxID=155976 RepID=A0A2S6GEX7_9PSEU|nr:type I-E CRISPR-associated protein Cas5/CasD [Actinokineospora auranticolor]PPK63769.1 CRISPR system Cascade subunit CasD [Actinokineospora auranticolor]